MASSAASSIDQKPQPTIPNSAMLSYEIASLPMDTVTVFADRAEVKRLFKTELTAGDYDLVLDKLPKTIEQKSIRIDGRGNATLGEVLYGNGKLNASAPEVRKMKEKQNKLQMDRKQRLELQQCLRRKRDTLDGIHEKIGCSNTASNTPVISFRFDFPDGYLKDLDEFFKCYDQRVATWNQQLVQVENEISTLENEISTSEYQLKKLTDPNSEPESITVKMQVKTAGQIELHVTYVVREATWEPSYEMSVSTAKRTPKLFYFGLVKQTTGETWLEGAKLVMSTVNTNLDGQIPKLGMLQVDNEKRVRPPPPRMEKSEDMHNPAYQSMQVPDGGFETMAAAETTVFEKEKPPPPPPRMRTVAAKVEKAAISASFQADRSTTILSDGVVHKVAIAQMDLVPTKLEYVAIPSKKPLAYLVAHVKNTSDYPLLAAPCSIFWDNTFTCESQLEAVRPQEEFTCSLGVDAAVQIDNKACKIFNEETGLMSKSIVQTREQKIRIKNTRTDAITVTVGDRYPLSNDEKIKVELLIPKQGPGITVSKGTGRVEWKLQLKGGQEETLMLKYKTEYPKEIRLDYIEVKE